MAQVTTRKEIGTLFFKRKTHHPKHAESYWHAQATADANLFAKYNAPDVASIVVGSTIYPMVFKGTRHLRIVYDDIIQNTNTTDTKGGGIGRGGSWEIAISLAWHYSVYESTDFNAVSAYATQFRNYLQPIIAYLDPKNGSIRAAAPAAASASFASSNDEPGDEGSPLVLGTIIEFPQDTSEEAVRRFMETSLDEWKAKTEKLESQFAAAYAQGGDGVINGSA